MLFNSFEFAVFLPLVFAIYWFLLKDKLRLQNIFLILASYLFYGWWDWRFLSLIIISSFVDYKLGILIFNQGKKKKRKYLLWLSLLVNLGFLGYFKYYNFFVDSFVDAFAGLGISLQARSLNVILPVGISFYTFQTLSYSLDIYKHKIKPTYDIFQFFAFVSFFPQLVAGPIERASQLLPQFSKNRNFDIDKAKDGIRQIMWGFFKKIVIADNAATVVNRIFDNSEIMHPFLLWVGAIFFAFQIYGDFSGYSDIAIGTSRLFGFNLMRNFNLPYFSKDFSEFWRRWHISLSTWLRDYLFLPISYSTLRIFNKNTFLKIKVEIWAYLTGILLTWFLGGLWHGAKWTFILWGSLHGLYLMLGHSTKKIRKRLLKKMSVKKTNPVLVFFQIIGVFLLTSLAWVFFRAEDIGQAFSYLNNMLSFDAFHIPLIPFQIKKNFIILILFVAAEYIQRNKQHVLSVEYLHVTLRWFSYIFTLYIILLFGNFNKIEFIYFQF
ncbi:MAG: MBOAT family O-acyltransferase [Bacteroidota bacterium]|nr:MBOAT family O-acyltransferase [Bacteroidota bacterium]